MSASPKHAPDRRRQWAWALYDWGNSAFATTVMAGFFPIFFNQYWATDLGAAGATFWLGAASSLSSLLIVLLAPLAGTVADRSALKKPFLAVFTVLGVLSTAALSTVAAGRWQPAIALFALGSVAFMGGTVFYDALLVSVAEPDRYDRVSSLGYGLGYLGGGLLFALNVAMALKPEAFGLADAAAATRLSFLMVAAWWGLFSLPLFAYVPEPREARRPLLPEIARGIGELLATYRELRAHRDVWIFLLAYWLYIDGVDTIIRMAVDYGLALGFESSALITALLMVQFIGFPAAIVFGRLGERLGTRGALFAGLGVYIGVTAYAVTMRTQAQFYVMAAVVGLVQGGVQALSRSYFARLIPPERSGQFFGFYNMLGKFAAVLGPLAVGSTRALTGDARLSILVLLLFFVGGIWLLSRVRAPVSSQPTAAMERR